MADFRYIAVLPTGQRVEGVRAAETQKDIVDYLNSQGMTIVRVEELIGTRFKKLLSTDIGGLGLNEKVTIAKQLATMASAGIPIIQSLDILVQQSDKDSVKDKFKKIYKLVESGSALSDAFGKVGGIFSEVQINLLAAGEKSGNLNEMLLKIADDLEKNKNLRGKITGALIYPAIIFVVMIAVLFLMIGFMIPQVKQLYSSLGRTDLPALTQFLITIGNVVTNVVGIIALIITLGFAFIIYRYYASLPQGRLKIDRLKLKIPVFGDLMQKIEIAEFCRILAMLLISGIPIIEAIQIVSRASGNAVYKNILTNVQSDLSKGNSIAVGLSKFNSSNAFPVILIKMIATGEESGKLDVVLNDMATFYSNEVDQIASNLTKLMEPFILIVVGVMVGFMAVSIYLPIYEVGQSIST